MSEIVCFLTVIIEAIDWMFLVILFLVIALFQEQVSCLNCQEKKGSVSLLACHWGSALRVKQLYFIYIYISAPSRRFYPK